MKVVPKDDLASYIGVDQEPSDWLLIDQNRINQFADATEDHQFIHIDPEQASKGPFGATIAHGFLSLSLVSHLATFNSIVPEGMAMIVNYGSDKVRFLSPVRVDSRVRANCKLIELTPKGDRQILAKTAVTIEIENEPKPALVAEILSLFVLS